MTDGILAEIWERPWLAVALIATVPGIVLAMLGPFGSFSAPFWMRFAYWVPTMALGAGIGAGLNMWAEESPLFDRRPIARFLTVTTLLTAAMTLVAYGFGVAVFGPERMRFSPMLVFYVWVLTLVMSMAGAILRARRTTQAAAPLPAPADIRPAKLSQRLPVKLQDAAILALQGEDHYVRIHTDKGSDLILLRLSDAITEMGQTPGARTHRSWWVSKAAVANVRRDNGRIALALTNGTEAPVSRGYASELREAGWLN
ncbi:MAG: LytTR family DNA-binding domain-containing protein [Micropepsaceae bacterium]